MRQLLRLDWMAPHCGLPHGLCGCASLLCGGLIVRGSLTGMPVPLYPTLSLTRHGAVAVQFGRTFPSRLPPFLLHTFTARRESQGQKA